MYNYPDRVSRFAKTKTNKKHHLGFLKCLGTEATNHKVNPIFGINSITRSTMAET